MPHQLAISSLYTETRAIPFLTALPRAASSLH
jgi:hypothetical protein